MPRVRRTLRRAARRRADLRRVRRRFGGAAAHRAGVALASALACDGETTGWRCSDGNACAHQPHALRRVMLHWKPAAGATGTDAAEDDFFGDDEPPGGPSETITL